MPQLDYGDPLIIGYMITVVCLGIGISLVVLWFWMIVECATKESPKGRTRLVWMPLIVLLPGVGALIYFISRRPERILEFGE